MNNNVYNLLTQLTQEMRALWRIEKHYISESMSAPEKALWEQMKTEKSAHVEELSKILKEAL